MYSIIIVVFCGIYNTVRKEFSVFSSSIYIFRPQSKDLFRFWQIFSVGTVAIIQRLR